MRFRKNKLALRIVCAYMSLSFLGTAIFPGYIQAQEINLPSPKEFVPLSSPYTFPVLKGLKFEPSNPFVIEFIVDTADEKNISQQEAARLVRYFLAGLT